MKLMGWKNRVVKQWQRNTNMAMVGTAQLHLVFFVFSNTIFIHNTCKIVNLKIIQEVLRLQLYLQYSPRTVCTLWIWCYSLPVGRNEIIFHFIRTSRGVLSFVCKDYLLLLLFWYPRKIFCTTILTAWSIAWWVTSTIHCLLSGALPKERSMFDFSH